MTGEYRASHMTVRDTAWHRSWPGNAAFQQELGALYWTCGCFALATTAYAKARELMGVNG